MSSSIDHDARGGRVAVEGWAEQSDLEARDLAGRFEEAGVSAAVCDRVGSLDADLWAGGDDRGPGIASRGIAQGRFAAEAAHAELRGEQPPATHTRPVPAGAVKTDYYPEQARSGIHRRPAGEWLSNPDREIDQTLDYEQACKEAARCMSCGLCFDCEQCFMYCNAGGFTRIKYAGPGHYYALALDACEGCGKCIELCPCGYLEPRDDASR